MVDFVKLKILNPDIKGIRNLSFLEWEQTTNEQTGEIKNNKAEFKSLTVEIRYNQYLYISGSLHKYWNSINTGIEQNYNDFHFKDLECSIKDICTRFNLNPVNCKIDNIEFGVNVNTPIPVNEVLRSVINHKGKPFTTELEKKKYLRECKHQRYFIKIYDKGLQNDLTENIFRFEIKHMKLEDLKPFNILTLANLLKRDNISRLIEVLDANFNELLFYDYTIQETELPPPKRLILSNGQIPTYWIKLKETNPDNYFKKRQRFRVLVKKYGKQNIQESTGNLITQKWNELLLSDTDYYRI